MHDLLQPGLDAAEVEDLARVDRTHVSLYTDPDIFKQEMEKIFYTTWVFVGHESEIAKRMPQGVKAWEALEALRTIYAPRGVNLVRVNRKWLFRTAADLGWLLSREQSEPRKLSRAAIETLAICAYHQPVTRAEIEDIRGVAISKGTLDVLLETGWVRIRGRRKAPGRPVT